MRLQTYFIFLICFIGIQFNSYAQNYDLGVIAIPSVDSTCFFTGNDSIIVEIENFGPTDATDFEVFYQVFNGQIVTDTFFGTLTVGSTALFTFPQTADLTKSYNSDVKSWTMAENELNSSNDSTILILDCVCTDSIGTPFVCNQMVSKYFATSTSADRLAARNFMRSVGVVILDSLECGTTFIDLLSSPDTILFNNLTIIGEDNQKEFLSTSGSSAETVELNYLGQSNTSTQQKSKLNHSITKLQKQSKDHQNMLTTDPVKVVILDSGMDTTQSLFLPYRMEQACPTCPDLPEIYLGYDYVNKDNDPSDDNGHGTNVATVIANEITNWNVDIIPLKVLDHEGEGTLWNICLGTITAQLLNADVINASFGWSGSTSTILKLLIKDTNLQCHGIFVTSAGNNSTDNAIIPHWPSNYTTDLDNVVAVTATDSLDATMLAGYANYGKDFVDLGVKGTYSVFDQFGNTRIKTGTSLAAAYVTSLATNALARNQRISALDFKTEIYNTGINQPLYYSASGLVVAETSFTANDTMSFFQQWAINLNTSSSCRIQSCLISSTEGFDIRSHNFQIEASPNPFSELVQFNFELESAETVHFWIYNIMGQPVYHTKKRLSAGQHQLKWDEYINGHTISKGMYIAYIQVGETKGRQLFIKQ